MIQYLHHSEINKSKWDNTVSQASNALPYALSWYLDIVSPQWDALIEGDYEMVMPVTVKQKWGLRYAIQPPFSQQLGVFSSHHTHVNAEKFCKLLAARYGYINIQLNASNTLPYHATALPNYLLPLNQKYDSLYQSFAENHRRNIKKIARSQQISEIDCPLTEIETFIHKHETHIKIHTPILFQITRAAILKGHGEWQVAANENNEIVCAIFWLKFKQRHIYLYSLASDQGKEKRAGFFLVHQYIRKHAGESIIIDFEGSRIPGIARFFEGFGAKPEYYPIFQYRSWWKLIVRSLVPD